MPRIVLLLSTLVAVLAGRPVEAGTILYATAATPGRVDGFCVGGGGALAGPATVQVGTAPFPRRVLVRNGVLYVGEADRVEAYAIGAHGGLKRLNVTKVENPNMNVGDMALSPDGHILYVAQNGFGRIVAYPLDTDGSFANDRGFTSCVQGQGGSTLMAIQIHLARLYLSTQFPGRIAMFALNPDGSLPQLPSECGISDASGKRPPPTPATSERTKLGRLRSFVFSGDLLYVEKVGTQRILQFQLLPDGTFEPAVQNGKKLEQQKPASKTNEVLWYADLQLYKSTLVGTQFGKGRVDAYRVKSDGHVPKSPTRISKSDVRASPVRMAISPDGVMYVSGGDFDRIEAFHMRDSDGLPATVPFSMTDVLTDSFPNDVALATLTDDCQ